MMRRLALLLPIFLVAGCLTAGKRGGDTAIAVYDLGPVAESRVAAQRPVPLAVEVRAPAWFDAPGISYRLAYAEPARLREYAQARWAGPPAQMIQQYLIRDLALVPAGQSRAGCLLRIDIDEFSQVFKSPEVSHGVLLARVQWLDRSRARLAERRISSEPAAVSADSRGGVAALTSAVIELSAQLRSWEGELLASGMLQSCLRQ